MECVLVYLHSLDEVLVEAVAVEVVARYQRLQDEPEALLHHLAGWREKVELEIKNIVI